MLICEKSLNLNSLFNELGISGFEFVEIDNSKLSNIFTLISISKTLKIDFTNIIDTFFKGDKKILVLENKKYFYDFIENKDYISFEIIDDIERFIKKKIVSDDEKSIFEKIIQCKIPKVYCISLENCTERQENVKKFFESTKQKFEFIIAKPLKDPVRGCAESHLNCIREAKRNNYNFVMICEDDVSLFESHLEQINPVVLPEGWEMFYFGYNSNSGKKYQKNVVMLNSAFGGHCYLVHSSIYDKILEDFDKDYWMKVESIGNEKKYKTIRAIDVFYAKCIHRRNKSFGIYPLLCGQQAGFSSIENKFVDYNDLFILNSNNCLESNYIVAAYDGKLNNFPSVVHNYKLNDFTEIFDLKRFDILKSRQIIRNNNGTHNMKKEELEKILNNILSWIEFTKLSKKYLVMLSKNVKLGDNFIPKIEELCKKNFDLCFLNYSHVNDKEEFDDLRKMNKTIIRQLYPVSYGYIISKSGIEKLVKMLNTNGIQQVFDMWLLENSNIVDSCYTKTPLLTPIYDEQQKNIYPLKEEDENFCKEVLVQGKLMFLYENKHLFYFSNDFEICYHGRIEDEKIIQDQIYRVSNIKMDLDKNKKTICIYAGDKMSSHIKDMCEVLSKKYNIVLYGKFNSEMYLNNVYYRDIIEFGKCDYDILVSSDTSIFLNYCIEKPLCLLLEHMTMPEIHLMNLNSKIAYYLFTNSQAMNLFTKTYPMVQEDKKLMINFLKISISENKPLKNKTFITFDNNINEFHEFSKKIKGFEDYKFISYNGYFNSELKNRFLEATEYFFTAEESKDTFNQILAASYHKCKCVNSKYFLDFSNSVDFRDVEKLKNSQQLNDISNLVNKYQNDTFYKFCK